MLYAGDVCFQGAHVGRDFCAYRTPVSAGGITNGPDFLIDLFDRRCGSSTRLLLARHDLVMRFLLRSIRGIFSILGMNRQVGELFRESLSHVFAPLVRK
jgi:hypothetical protein